MIFSFSELVAIVLCHVFPSNFEMILSSSGMKGLLPHGGNPSSQSLDGPQMPAVTMEIACIQITIVFLAFNGIIVYIFIAREKEHARVRVQVQVSK